LNQPKKTPLLPEDFRSAKLPDALSLSSSVRAAIRSA
jgi:hypothetical protein